MTERLALTTRRCVRATKRNASRFSIRFFRSPASAKALSLYVKHKVAQSENVFEKKVYRTFPILLCADREERRCLFAGKARRAALVESREQKRSESSAQSQAKL